MVGCVVRWVVPHILKDHGVLVCRVEQNSRILLGLLYHKQNMWRSTDEHPARYYSNYFCITCIIFLSTKTPGLALDLTASYSMGTRVPSHGWSSQSMMLTTHLHLSLRLRMSRAVPLLPPGCLHGIDRDNFTFFTCHCKLRVQLKHISNILHFLSQSSVFLREITFSLIYFNLQANINISLSVNLRLFII